MATVLVAVIIIAFAGLGFGLAIGYVAKTFAVEVDPRLEEVIRLLPGVNCGGCGFAGCAEFAKSLVAGQAGPGQCPVSSAAAVASIAAMMHLSVEATASQVAVVFCGGDVQHSQRVRYNGVTECLSAALVASGGKACGYGCMGYGSCAQACPLGAIELRRGLAVVHPELCTGCGTCVAVCPRKLIRLVPASAGVHILCSAKSKPVSKRKLCQTACVACKKCVRAAPGGHWLTGANLIQINYANPPPPEIVAHAGCPTGCLKNAVDHVANRERG